MNPRPSLQRDAAIRQWSPRSSARDSAAEHIVGAGVELRVGVVPGGRTLAVSGPELPATLVARVWEVDDVSGSTPRRQLAATLPGPLPAGQWWGYDGPRVVGWLLTLETAAGVGAPVRLAGPIVLEASEA